MHSDADPGALSQVFTRKRPGALSSNTVTGSWTSRRYNGQETVMTDRRKRITSFPLPFYHGYRKRYKCVKLPSWDTAKGGHEGSFLQWYVLQGREASRKVCVQDRG